MKSLCGSTFNFVLNISSIVGLKDHIVQVPKLRLDGGPKPTPHVMDCSVEMQNGARIPKNTNCKFHSFEQDHTNTVR